MSVAVPQYHRGTVTVMRLPAGTVTTGWGAVSVRVIPADPGGPGHDRSIREWRLAGCVGAADIIFEQLTAPAAAIASVAASLRTECARRRELALRWDLGRA
jgi:hypothetical protein